MLLTRRNLRDTHVDMVDCSETQEAKHATNALLANRAALTQNMNFVHLKTKVSGSTHGGEKSTQKGVDVVEMSKKRVKRGGNG